MGNELAVVAIRFNPLDKKVLAFDMIKTSFKVVDEFWIQTDKGPLIAGEVWKDTAINRAIISKIIDMKKEFNKMENDHGIAVLKLLNTRER